MRRWLLPFGQLILGVWTLLLVAIFDLWILPFVFFFLPIDILRGHLDQDLTLYGLGFSSASFFFDAAVLLCFGATVALFRNPSGVGARLSAAAAACYWLFIFGMFAMNMALSYPKRHLGDIVPIYLLLTALAAALLAFMVRRYVDCLRPESPGLNEDYEAR